MTKRVALVKAKFSGRCYDGSYFKRGDYVVAFMRNIFVGKDKEGKKQFINSYIQPFKMKNFPEMAEAREKLISIYGKSFDHIGELKTIFRK